MWAKYALGYTGIGVFEEQFLAVRIDDEQCKVFNMLEDPAYVENLKLTRDWYNKGYIAKDGLTYSQDQWNQLVNNGKIAIDLHNTWIPGGNIVQMPFGEDQGAYRFGKVFVEGASVTSTLTAVSAQSKHKEKAIEVMEYLWTHPDAFNLLGFGIEGQHYEKVDDNVIKVDTNSGYYTATSWLYGNEAIIGAYIQYPSPPDRNRMLIEYTEKAAVPPIMGFVLDMEEIKTLVASINAVVDQYHMPVGGGYVDLETELPKYLDALEQAGSDELIAKIQAQIDAWLASK
jgi:putative aldouronate transport system substrate-binding protein